MKQQKKVSTTKMPEVRQSSAFSSNQATAPAFSIVECANAMEEYLDKSVGHIITQVPAEQRTMIRDGDVDEEFDDELEELLDPEKEGWTWEEALRLSALFYAMAVQQCLSEDSEDGEDDGEEE